MFIEHAIQLEDKRPRGSVQRLLRMKSDHGRLPGDEASNQTPVEYFDDLLDQAVQRDGEVLYEFGDPDIAEIRSGEVSMDNLRAIYGIGIDIKPRIGPSPARLRRLL